MWMQALGQRVGGSPRGRRGLLLGAVPSLLIGMASAHAAESNLKAYSDARDAQAWRLELRLESAQAVSLVCDELAEGGERHLKRLPASTVHQTTFRGLKAATAYQCRALESDGTTALSSKVSFITAPLPLDLRPPVISVPSSDLPGTGYTLYNYGIYRGGFRNNYLVILDAEGIIRWYLPGPGAGDVDASYLGDDRILYGGMSATYYPPTVVGLDKVTQWTGTTAVVSPDENAGQTNHDAGLSQDGLSVFHLTYSTLNDYYLVYIVKQIDLASNTVIWSWDSVANGLEAGALPPGGGSSDLYHANSVFDAWENGRLYLYVGMRNLHRVIKIDYLTKEVVWSLGVGGDFTLLDANGDEIEDDSQWFFQQHDTKFFAPHLMSIYDNGTARTTQGGANYSRALQLELDEVAMTARIVFEYTESTWEEPYWGGYDVLSSGNSLIAMGHFSGAGGDHNSCIVEVAPSGNVVWRADFRTEKDAIYRAERIGGCDIFDNLKYCPRGN